MFDDELIAHDVFHCVTESRETLAACLMPDHLHWLVADGDSMIQLVSSFKSWTTRRSWRRGHRGRLWQRSYHDHVVRSVEDVREVVRYIVHNPVRAGLVDDWRSYPYTVVFDDRISS